MKFLNLKSNKWLKISLISLLTLTLISGIAFAGIKTLSPDRFAYPKQDHFHFRLQYVFRGEAENFGSAKYQVDYIKDVCTGDLTESPIHFHDNKNQIVHLHWQGMTGGDVLKFYGLNKTGGLDNLMGFKMDQLLQFPPKITSVPIHSQLLPKAAGEDKYFIYTGDASSYQEKDFNDFINQSLEQFIGVDSKIRKQKEEAQKLEQQINFNPLAVQAQAHAGEEHETVTEAQQHEIDVRKSEEEKRLIEERNNTAKQAELNSASSSNSAISTSSQSAEGKTEEELKEINNLLGNVVIFVQPNQPSSEQIKARFNQLEPLGLSVCGG